MDKIIDMKTRSQEYKEHPDAPGDVNATLFYVLVDLERVAEDEHEERLSLTVSGEATGDQVLYVKTCAWLTFQTTYRPLDSPCH